jgi:hypothetical protein
LFDTIDKLYGTKGGGETTAQATAAGEETVPPPSMPGGLSDLGGETGEPDLGGEIPPAGEEAAAATAGGEITPESKKRDMNILIESDMWSSKFLDLGVGQQSLGEIGDELDKLLNS